MVVKQRKGRSNYYVIYKWQPSTLMILSQMTNIKKKVFTLQILALSNVVGKLSFTLRIRNSNIQQRSSFSPSFYHKV